MPSYLYSPYRRPLSLFTTCIISCAYMFLFLHTIKKDIYCLLFMGFPVDSVVKNPPANARDSGSISGSGRAPGGGNSNPLQYSCLRNPMDRGAWWTTQSIGLQRVRYNLQLSTNAHYQLLQYISCIYQNTFCVFIILFSRIHFSF